MSLLRSLPSTPFRFRKVLSLDLLKRQSRSSFVLALFNREAVRSLFENVLDRNRLERFRKKLSHRKTVILSIKPNEFSCAPVQTDCRNRISFHDLINIKRRKK